MPSKPLFFTSLENLEYYKKAAKPVFFTAKCDVSLKLNKAVRGKNRRINAGN